VEFVVNMILRHEVGENVSGTTGRGRICRTTVKPNGVRVADQQIHLTFCMPGSSSNKVGPHHDGCGIVGETGFMTAVAELEDIRRRASCQVSIKISVGRFQQEGLLSECDTKESLALWKSSVSGVRGPR